MQNLTIDFMITVQKKQEYDDIVVQIYKLYFLCLMCFFVAMSLGKSRIYYNMKLCEYLPWKSLFTAYIGSINPYLLG